MPMSPARAGRRALRRARDAFRRRARGGAAARAAGADRSRDRARTGARGAAARRRAGGGDVARRARRPAGAAQERPARAPERRRCAGRVRRLRDRRLGRVAAAGAARGARLRLARPDPRAGDGTRRLLAHGTRAVRRRLSRRRPRPQQLQLPPHARRLDDGKRRARDRLHGPAGRHRADRAAAAGDGRARARRLCRNAELPAPSPREGRRDRHRAAVADQGRAERRGGAARRARVARHARHRRLPVVRHGRPRPRRVRDGRRARDSSSTRASSSRSSARGPATRSPTARWARSS